MCHRVEEPCDGKECYSRCRGLGSAVSPPGTTPVAAVLSSECQRLTNKCGSDFRLACTPRPPFPRHTALPTDGPVLHGVSIPAILAGVPLEPPFSSPTGCPPAALTFLPSGSPVDAPPLLDPLSDPGDQHPYPPLLCQHHTCLFQHVLCNAQCRVVRCSPGPRHPLPTPPAGPSSTLSFLVCHRHRGLLLPRLTTSLSPPVHLLCALVPRRLVLGLPPVLFHFLLLRGS